MPILWHSQKLTQNKLKTNVKPKTVKLLEENNIGGNLLNIGFGNNFLDTTAKVNKLN